MPVKLTPAEFGRLHAQLFDSVVRPVTEKLGVTSINNEVVLDMAYAPKAGNDLGLIYDNVKSVRGEKRSLKLAAALQIDAAQAEEAAAQAAKTTGGELTNDSARFLGRNFRDDFERITGEKVDAEVGIPVDGVTIRTGDAGTEVQVDFARALAGVTAHEAVLAIADRFVLHATRLPPPLAHPELPPYQLVLSPRTGHSDGLSIRRDSGTGGFGNPSLGSLVWAGDDTMQLLADRDQVVETLTFHVDQVNGYGDGKEPSEKTRAAREAWLARFDRRAPGFDVTGAVAAGTLTRLTRDELDALPGIKTLLSGVRADAGSGWSITRLQEQGLLDVLRDPASSTVAVVRTYGGGTHGGMLYLHDLAKERWVGTWIFQDDGAIKWIER